MSRYLAGKLIIVALLAGCGGPSDMPSALCWGGKCEGASAPNEAGPSWVADWTVLVYAANDDTNTELVDAFGQDLDEELRIVGGSSKFRMLIQRDYASHQLEGQRPRPSERYTLYGQERFDPRNGQRGVWTLGETDTTQGKTLEDFLVYGVRRYPAKRYWLIITGHGDSWNGLAFDACTEIDESGACRAPKNARLPLAQLAQALGSARAQAERMKQAIGIAHMNGDSEITVDYRDPEITVKRRKFEMVNVFDATNIATRKWDEELTKKIDVLQFDACHMGNLETAFSLRDSVDYMIGSQEVIPNAGHPYAVLSAAQGLSGAGGSAAVKAVVMDYVRTYVDGVSTRAVNSDYVGTTVTSVGVNLNKLEGVRSALKQFQAEALAAWPGGLSCQQLDRISTAARKRAQLDATYAESTVDNSRCSNAAIVDFKDGLARVGGDLNGATDEAGSMACGTPMLPGPQRYYRFAAVAGRTYDVTMMSTFDGSQGYMFASSSCDPAATGSACTSSTTGLMRRRQRKTMQLTVPADAQAPQVTVVVDSNGNGGKFMLVIKERKGRATAAYNAAVDVSALFQVLAGEDLYQQWVVRNDPDNCAFNGPGANPLADLVPSNVQQAAIGVINAMGRPYIRKREELQDHAKQTCGVDAMFGGTYRELNEFQNPDSPLVIEAHYIKHSSKRRATGLSMLFGDIFPLASVEQGSSKSRLADYQALPFNRDIAWTSVFQACINEVEACRQWTQQGAVGASLCENIPF